MASCPAVFQPSVFWLTVLILSGLQLLSVTLLKTSVLATEIESTTSSGQPQTPARDLRWPRKQFNVLLDNKSLNSTQRLIIDAFLDQLQHRTCLKINKLSRGQVNPFSVEQQQHEDNSSFVYIFKSPSSFTTTQAQFIGLSSFGCLKQGRQSMILTDVAFQFPRLVLRYHLLHTLGLANLSRPDEQVRQLLGHHLPMNQKIRKQSTLDRTLIYGPYYAYATMFKSPPEESIANSQELRVESVEYLLSDEDLIKLKELYNCTEFQSRLPTSSPTLSATTSLASSSEHVTPRPEEASSSPTSTEATRRRGKDASPDEQAAAVVSDIASSLLGDATPDADGAPTTTPRTRPSLNCANDDSSSPPPRPAPTSGDDGLRERPMLLKLDQFHAQDPQLMRANQMKLSFLGSGGTGTGSGSGNISLERLNSLDGHKLLNIAADLVPNSQESSRWAKSEMLISFEQSGQKPAASSVVDPVSSLVGGTQVLKLCSCTCQTMAPSLGGASTLAPATTAPSTLPPSTSAASSSSSTQLLETTTSLPPTTSSEPPTTEPAPPVLTTLPPIPTQPTQTQVPPQTSSRPSSTPQQEPEPPTQTEPTEPTEPAPAPTTSQPPEVVTSSTSGTPVSGPAACELVEWVKPSKSIYSSAKIVWDMDRANQNYFICQTMINGELVPGKTHGFSCKVSSSGMAYEMHNFKVLIKPETVSLAWVQRRKGNLGRNNQAVVGGHSRSPAGSERESYVVARCLVRDENNDVITLIGYVNSQGLGWFPFDDIQIECAQYDVLACVTS